VISRSDRLDILILNAGIMNIPGTTETGQDMQMGTNHVGHFLLTRSLLPLLQKTAKQPNADVRVVTVASDAYSLAPKLETMLSTEKLLKTNLYTRYGASKAANILFAAEFASRYPEITTVSLHPGLIKTDLFEPNLGPIMRFGVGLVGPLLYQNIPTGALNQLWAAAGAEKQTLVNGGYYTPIGQAKKNKWSTDPAASKKFWEWTENELKAAGY
jgi:NAD(P)-dependent dehydrogenase (short-subunit alcohol dehydrogenase family)